MRHGELKLGQRRELTSAGNEVCGTGGQYLKSGKWRPWPGGALRDRGDETLLPGCEPDNARCLAVADRPHDHCWCLDGGPGHWSGRVEDAIRRDARHGSRDRTHPSSD